MKVLSILIVLAQITHAASYVARPYISNKRSYQNYRLHYSNDHVVEEKTPQVLSFIEPTTGVQVTLVGCMHYNPTSIQLAETLVTSSASQGKLKAVLVESCPTRWNKMKTRDDNLSKSILLKNLFKNEMRSASDIAKSYNIPTILCDQEISITNNRLKSSFIDAIKDLVLPFTGGWNNLYTQLKYHVQKSLPGGDEYLGTADFLDPSLILTMPISLFRYILAIVLKSPLVGVGLLLSIVAVPSASTMNYTEDFTIYDRIFDIITSISISFLESILLATIFLNALLTERNEIIAENIIKSCLVASADSSNTDRRSSNSSSCSSSSSSSSTSTSPRAEVIAVLGMAHCNGVKKLLIEEGITIQLNTQSTSTTTTQTTNTYNNNDKNNKNTIYDINQVKKELDAIIDVY